MRFREYESTPSATTSRDQQPCVEYDLRDDGVRKDGQSTQQLLVWSASKSKPASDDAAATANSHTTDDNTITESGGGMIISILKSVHKPRIITDATGRIVRLSRDLFLPIGYPSSVAEGYLEYQFYDSLQGLCSYLRGVVSTSAVLSAAGVGDAEATAMSAAMTWAVRDGLGMIGGLLFSYVASPHFDAHVKEFRLLADVLNDVAMTLDMALPLLLAHPWIASPPQLFVTISHHLPVSAYLVLTSISTLCKVSCGMAAGATKGNITDHFAISGNRADCQSKESTQETLVSLVGMCCGVWLANVLHGLERRAAGEGATGAADEVCTNSGEEDNNNICHASNINNISGDDVTTIVRWISWSIFIILTLVHVWANYVGMQILKLRTLNRERATVALQPLVEYCDASWREDSRSSRGDRKNPRQLSIEEATRARNAILPPTSVSESLWKSMYGMVYPECIRLGTSLKSIVRRCSPPSYLSKAVLTKGQWHSEKYMIFIVGSGRNDSDDTGKGYNLYSITVALRVGANDRDELKAFLHAHLLHHCMQRGERKLPLLLSWSYDIVQRLFSSSTNDTAPEDQIENDGGIDLNAVLGEKGWDTTRLYLGFGPWRCEWDDDDDG